MSLLFQGGDGVGGGGVEKKSNNRANLTRALLITWAFIDKR